MKKDPLEQLIQYQEIRYKCKYIDGKFVYIKEPNGKEKKANRKFYSK